MSYQYYNDDGKDYAVSTITGEIVDAVRTVVPVGSKILTPEQQEIIHKKRKKKLLMSTNSELGTFYFLRKESELDAISPETVGRLIYLFSFLGLDNNKLMITKRREMKKSDLIEVMHLSLAAVKRFWKAICPKYITENNDGTLIVTNSDIVRGTLKNNHEVYQKLYIKSIQQLYRKTPPTKHRYLGYIYQLLPYINIEHNIICENPYEKNLDDIIPLNVVDLCESINYDVHNFGRLRSVYNKMTFIVNGQEQYFISFVSNDNSLENTRMFINPHILYNGTNFKKVEELGFLSKKQKNKKTNCTKRRILKSEPKKLDIPKCDPS